VDHRTNGEGRLDRRRISSFHELGGLCFGCGGWLVAGVVALLAASATFAGGHGGDVASRTAAAQLSDRIVTPDERQLAKIYVTELEWGADEMSWGVRALPCKGEHFRLLSTQALIASSDSSRGEAEVVIKSEQLSGLPCNEKVHGIEEGEPDVSVYSLRPRAFAESPRKIYEYGGTRIRSFSPCVTLSRACPGAYLLRVRLTAPRRVELEFVFTISHSTTTHAGASDARI
jgi:hypothetical protein